MARKEITTVTLTDDLTGEDITESNPGVFAKITVEVDGDRERVELDLTKVNYDALRELLAPYFAAGNVSRGKGSVPAGDPEYNTKVREFAAKVTRNGEQTYDYNDEKLTNPGPRGRVPQNWKDAYAAFLDQSARVDAADAANANGNGAAEAKPKAKASK